MRIFGILSKSKGEASRIEGLSTNNLCSDLPRPYATLKFKEDTKFICSQKIVAIPEPRIYLRLVIKLIKKYIRENYYE